MQPHQCIASFHRAPVAPRQHVRHDPKPVEFNGGAQRDKFGPIRGIITLGMFSPLGKQSELRRHIGNRRGDCLRTGKHRLFAGHLDGFARKSIEAG